MSGHHKLMKAADVQPPPPLKVPPLPMTDGADADRTVKLPPAPEPSGPARPKVSFFDPSKLNTASPSVAQEEQEPRPKSNRARSASSLTMGRTKELNPESKVAILSSNLGGILAGSPPSERNSFLPQLMTNHGDAKSAPPSPAQLRRSDTLPGLASGSPPPVQRAYLGPTRSSSSDGLDLSSIRRGGSSPLRAQLSTSAGSAELSRTLPKLNSSPSLALKTVNAKPSAGEFSFGGGDSDNPEEAEDGGSGNNKRSSLRRVVVPMKSRSVTCDNLQRSIQEEKGRQTCFNEDSSAASSEGSALRRSESSGPPAFGPSSTKAKALAATLKLQMRLPGEAPPFLDEVKQRQTQLPQPPQQPQQGLQQQQQQPPQSQQQLQQQQQKGALLGPNIPQGMAARRSVRDSSRRRSLPLGIVGSPDNRKSYGLQLDTIVELLNGPNGLPTEKKARKQKGETFSRWFTGKRAAEWFMEQQLVETMEEATEFGNLLIRTGLFFPVVASDSFKPRKKSIYALQKQPEIQKGGAPPVESETRVMISAISSDSIDSSSLTQIGPQEQLKQEEEKERKQIEEQEQRKKESLKQILERKSNKKEKEKKQKEQQSLKKKELAEKKKEERAKRKSRRKSRKMAGVYGASLDYVMSLQEDEHPELEIPIVLMALTKSLMDLNAHRTEGIFRVPGTAEGIATLRDQLNRGEYEITCTSPHVVAGCLKLWFRELEEPLIPAQYYDACIKAANDTEECLKIIDQIPETNKKVLQFITCFLFDLAADENVEVTKMGVDNLSMIFAPGFLRCTDVSKMMVNVSYEGTFVQQLIENLPMRAAEQKEEDDGEGEVDGRGRRGEEEKVDAGSKDE